VPVPSNILIPNCLRYGDFNTCIECTANFANVNGLCVTAIAQNCQTYVSASACLTCKPGFGIKEEAGLVNCVSNSIPNCLQPTSIFPFTCNTCEAGYYPSNGICATITTPITGCLLYDTSNTCAKCDSAYALSGDGLRCESISTMGLLGIVSQNCNASSIRAEHTCVACASGFYFKNGACVRCETEPGCAGCLDSSPRVCQACLPGYEMNPNNSCSLRAKGLRAENSEKVQHRVKRLSDHHHKIRNFRPRRLYARK